MERFLAALIDRPVAVSASYLLVGVFAIGAVLRLPVELLPSLRYPALAVWTALPDVAPEQVERTVTEPVEQAVSGLAGLRSMASRSQLGGSLVRLDFGWNADVELAGLELREKLERLAGVLPATAGRPLVLHIDPGARPILVFALSPASGAAEDPEALLAVKEVAREVVARRLESLEGVARARVTGAFERQIEVTVDAQRLAAYDLDIEGVAASLAAANVSLAGGVLRRGPFLSSVEVSGELRDAADVATTLVSAPGQPPVVLGDVAAVRTTQQPRRGLARLDGKEALLVLVERTAEANTVRTAGAVRAAIDGLARDLPGVRFDAVIDESVFISTAIGNVVSTLVGGALLTTLVLLFFVRRPVALAATAIAVPAGLALTLVLFDLLGVSFNLISLSGLALGVGLLLDNSTVVAENIASRREEGLPARLAAARGTAEVAGPITISTLTTAIVFLPITFVEGLAGRLFRDQSLAVVLSVGASLVAALTLVPLIAARDRSSSAERVSERTLGPALRSYEALLALCLRHRRATLAATAALLLGATALALELPRETVPHTEMGRLHAELGLPTDAGLELVSQRAAALEAAVGGWPEVTHVLAELGERDDAQLELEPRPPYRAELTVMLRPGSAEEPLLERLRQLHRPSDLALEARSGRPQLETLLTSGGAELAIDLGASHRGLAEAALPDLLERLTRRGELASVARREPESVAAYRLVVDHEAVVRFGASPRLLQSHLEAAVRGHEATRVRRVNDEVPVVLRAPSIDSIERLLAVSVPVRSGRLPLSSLVRVEPIRVPAVLLRSEQAPVLRLSADVAPGATLQGAVAAIERDLASLPPTVRGSVGGANQAFRSSLAAVAKTLALSVLLVFLLLAAQFDSFLLPVVILSAVPLAFIGIVPALALSGQSWNLMSLTACVVVVGVVDNDAIVKVDFIHRARRSGLAVEEAILAAGKARFRPIVINTVTAVLGLTPLALWGGQGGQLQASMAITIVGGLVGATALTLLVVPVIYALLLPDRSAMKPTGGT
jgi:HAE1 family hydrophobic/amphiphilic exporter-1